MAHSAAIERYIARMGWAMSAAMCVQHMSICKRAQVGCLILSPDLATIHSSAFNDQASGLDPEGCTGEVGACGCCHSEVTALLNLPRLTVPALMICTMKPCFNCANAIINSGQIVGVVAMNDCRHVGSEKKLIEAGVDFAFFSDLENARHNDLIEKWGTLGTRARRASAIERLYRAVPRP